MSHLPVGTPLLPERVLYVGPADVSVPSGPGVNEYEFIVAAEQVRGISWRFIVPTPRGMWPTDIPLDRCRHYPGRRKGVRPLNWLRTERELACLLRRELLEFRPDIIVARPGLLPIGMSRVLETTQVPYVLRHCPDGTLAEFARLRLLGPPLRSWNRRLLRRLSEKAILVELMSEMKLQRFRTHFPAMAGKAVLVRNGVNTARFQPRDRNEARRALGLAAEGSLIGYIGNYPWRRGGRTLVHVVRQLRDEGENVSAVILGDDGDRVRLRALADHLDVAEWCAIPGRVAFHHVVQYIAASDVCVSILEPREMHASAQKVLQYVACGRPAVVNHPDAAFVEDVGVGTFVDGDLRPIARAVQAWLHLQPPERTALEARARAYALDHLSYASRLNDRAAAWARAAAASTCGSAAERPAFDAPERSG